MLVNPVFFCEGNGGRLIGYFVVFCVNFTFMWLNEQLDRLTAAFLTTVIVHLLCLLHSISPSCQMLLLSHCKAVANNRPLLVTTIAIVL